VQNEIELFNGARTYATKNFGNSDFVKDALKAHKQFNRLYQLPVIQQYLRQERLSKDKNRSP